MSDERVAQIRARLAALLPGPWQIGEIVESHDWALGLLAIRAEDGDLVCLIPNHGWPEQRANAAIIASAPADVPYLLAALADAEARYTDLWDAFHEEQRLRNRRVDWQEADTRELLRSEYGIGAAAKPKN
jgi:hypothetical protein